MTCGPLAQSVEQGTFNPKVAGSIPSRPTISATSPAPEGGGEHQPDAGVSSNGRTLVFGASYLGSNPGTPAIWSAFR